MSALTLERDESLIVASGFRSLPINLPKSSMIKTLFFRPVQKKNDLISDESDKTIESRTIYVTNLAPTITEKEIRSIFNKIDSKAATGTHNASSTLSSMLKMQQEEETDIQVSTRSSQVAFINSRLEALQQSILGSQSNKQAFERAGFALVTFEDSDGFNYAMTHLHRMDGFGKSEKAVGGMSKWLQDWETQHRIDPGELQFQADKTLQAYDRRQRAHRKMEEQKSTLKDDDGWTQVAGSNTKKRARVGSDSYGTSKLTQSQLRKIKEEQDKRSTHNDFYKFQTKDTGNDKLEKLRRKFEHDKAKIKRIKNNSQRKFNPSR